jgi:hypothetical protein
MAGNRFDTPVVIEAGSNVDLNIDHNWFEGMPSAIINEGDGRIRASGNQVHRQLYDRTNLPEG